MIAHTSVGVKNYSSAKEFYKQLLAPLGYYLDMDVPEFKAAGFKNITRDFWIGEKEGATGVHVAFLAVSKEAVEAFHKAGLRAGGSDNGLAGYRKEYSPGYFAAFIHDADGNNIEAVWFDPEME